MLFRFCLTWNCDASIVIFSNWRGDGWILPSFERISLQFFQKPGNSSIGRLGFTSDLFLL